MILSVMKISHLCDSNTLLGRDAHHPARLDQVGAFHRPRMGRCRCSLRTVWSETGLLVAEIPAPVELSSAPGHVPVRVARAVTAIGWATIIVATLIHRPAPLLIAGTRGMPTPLVD